MHFPGKQYIVHKYSLKIIKLNWVEKLSCSGDTDAVVPVTATRYSIDALNLPTIVNWYPWYDEGKVSVFMTRIILSPFAHNVFVISHLQSEYPEKKKRVDI